MSSINKVILGSLAEELELQPGDEILTINGEEFHDILDFYMLFSDEYVEIEVKKLNGEIVIYEVSKDVDESIGVEWMSPTIDKLKLCHNKCVFCFVDQIPKNMRKSLQIRDDDYRLSFLQGNFVTLTNVSFNELDRIVKLNLSPINISVHTTNPELRVKMLGNKKAGDILDKIDYLASHNISMHTQIVLCPNYNDKHELDRTIIDLRKYYPFVKSISVVPVGLTDHRKDLQKITPLEEDGAIDAISIISKWQQINLDEFNAAVIYAADELYVLSDIDVPKAIMYDSFEQLENGVGLIRLFLDDLDICLKNMPKVINDKKYIVLTAKSAYKTIQQATIAIHKATGAVIDCHVIPNRFYGERVTVTGLLTGTDIIEEWKASQLYNKFSIYDEIIIPDIMLKDDEDIFLDNYSLIEVEQLIERKLTVINSTAYGLVKAIFKNQFNKSNHLDEIQVYQARIQRYEKSDNFA